MYHLSKRNFLKHMTCTHTLAEATASKIKPNIQTLSSSKKKKKKLPMQRSNLAENVSAVVPESVAAFVGFKSEELELKIRL